ncbi:MAG: hypothetical protein K2I44_10870, partial [Muribaculaceae bacterium]|nr:hypothetical protein [Muribaculaceae bacterium]
AISLIYSGCNRVKKTAAEEERERWLYSLNDSIASYQKRIGEATVKLDALHTEIGNMIVNFDHVSNPKLVEGYYIYKGWSYRYPLSSTGIVARITQDEGFEIIAALTGAHFNRISVGADGMEMESAVVPHDQALNYRTSALNSVCFFGSSADSIGKLISDKTDRTVTLSFFNGEKTGSYTVPADQKEMIAATWNLFKSQSEAHHLENEIPMLSRRIDVCRRMLEANDSINTEQE